MTQEEYDKLVETKAEAIYKTWKAKGGWRPWATGGNSLKQDEARQLARKDIGPVKIEQPKTQTMEQRALEAERQVGELRDEIALCVEAKDQLEELIGKVLGLLRADKSTHAQYAIIRHQGFPDDRKEWRNTTSTEGKDHE